MLCELNMIFRDHNSCGANRVLSLYLDYPWSYLLGTFLAPSTLYLNLKLSIFFGSLSLLFCFIRSAPFWHSIDFFFICMFLVFHFFYLAKKVKIKLFWVFWKLNLFFKFVYVSSFFLFSASLGRLFCHFGTRLLAPVPCFLALSITNQF